MGERELTVRERIVVHLSVFGRFAEEFECPEDMCQSGISAAIGKSRAHVTLELSRMKEAGLISERNAHIKGAKSKRKTYLLAPLGVMKNSEIVAFLDGMKLKVIDAGASRFLTGTEAAEHLRVNLGMPRMASLDAVIAAGSVLDLSRLRVPERKSATVAHMPPRPDGFLPRRETATIAGLLEKDCPNTIVLLGIPGMGKTALLSDLAWNLEPEFRVMYRRLYPFDSQRSVMVGMGSFLDGCGFPALKRYMAHPELFDLPEAGSHLAHCFSRERLLLVFDEYEQSDPGLRPLFSMLIEQISGSGSAMIIASSEKIDLYSVKDTVIDGKVSDISLGPMDRGSASELLGAHGGTGDSLAGGHPLTLKLLGAGMGPNGLAEFVEVDILGKDSGLSRLCRFSAVLRKPFTPDDLELYGFENAPQIRNNLAFERQACGGFMLHPAIASILLETTGRRMLRDIHSKAADFYMMHGIEPQEALHHLAEANSIRRAREMAESAGKSLLDTDSIEDLARITEHILSDGAASVALKVLASQVFDRAGRWGQALTLAQEVEESADDPRMLAEAMVLKTNILAKTGRLEEALASVPDLGTGAEQDAKVMYARAAVLRRMGRNREALKACIAAGRMAKGAGHGILAAQCVMEEAVVMAAMGDHGKALERLQSAMRRFESLNSRPDVIRCLINLGMVLRDCGRQEEAISALERAIVMSELDGLNRFRAHALANLTDLLNRRGDFQRSSGLASEAAEIFSNLGEPVMQAAAMLNLARALSKSDDRGRAADVMEEAIALLDARGLLKTRKAWLEDCASLLRDMGQSKRAKAILKRHGA